MAARGTAGSVALYDLKVGEDTEYQPVVDENGDPIADLSGNRIHSTVLLNKGYLTDQEGVLLCYDPATRVATRVVGLATPSEAPTVKQTWYRLLETWKDSGGAYQEWDETGNTVFTNLQAGVNEPGIGLPGTLVNRMRVDNTGGPAGEVLTKIPSGGAVGDPLGIALQTYQLGFWINQTSARTLIAFQWGQDKANEQMFQIDPAAANVSYPVFLDVGGIKTLNFLRAKNTQNVPTDRNERNLFVSGIVQCGRLSGQYQWRMTYYRPSTEEEGNPSEPGPGTPMEFVEGRSLTQTTATAMRRSAFLTGPTNPSRRAGDKKVFYRTGGVPSLSVDVMGQPVYTYVGECLDFSTAIDGVAMAGGFDFNVTDPSGLAVDDWVVLDPGGATEEYLQIAAITGGLCTAYSPLEYDHSSPDVVEVGLLDNVSNEVLAAEVRRLDLDRDPPPEGIGWIVALPNGRLFVAPFWEDGEFQALKGAFSSQPQPIAGRRLDMQIFPIAADPYTQRSLTQGFRPLVATDAQGDRIMWAGLFHGWLTVLTLRACYQTRDWSQAQWSSGSWIKRFDRGTISGDTVCEVNGALLWASDGPSVLMWDGSGGGPRDVSFLRVSRTLADAPAGIAEGEVLAEDATAYWQFWFALPHAKGQSIYYRLFMTPTDPLLGQMSDLTVTSIGPDVTVTSATFDFTAQMKGCLLCVPNPAPVDWLAGWYQILAVNEDTNEATLDRLPFVSAYGYTSEGEAAVFKPWNSRRLDYDVVNDAWEPCEHRSDQNEDGIGDLPRGWECGEVRYGYGDTRELFVAEMNADEGDVYQLEKGLTDEGVPIYVYASTPRLNTPTGDVRSLSDLFLRLARETTESDRIYVYTRMGGSEYQQKEVGMQVLLQGDGDTEIPVYQDLAPEVARGRWVQLILDGNVSQRPAPREFTGAYYDVGDRRINE